MNRRVRPIIAIFFLLLLPLCPSLSASDRDDFEYDIFCRDTALTVWIDLSFYLSEINRNKLAEGIDLALEIELTLVVPRRFWGSTSIARQSEIMKISYHRITENYLLSSSEKQPDRNRRFLAFDKLFDYLSDSVMVILTPFDSLDNQKRYTLEIKITGITLTALNLISGDDQDEDNQTALKSLFKEFLNLTGYGRKEFKVKSRPFSLEEIFPGH
ncbi:MAG: DUF4390 domain-containing protein [Candidatus Zixiibacteriota bacterium]